MKGKTLGYIKGVQNVPYCKANVDLKVGMGVILDRANKLAKLPASADEAKACHYIVSNINDKPELHNFSETLDVKKGEYVRADDLTSVANLEMEFADYEIDDDVDDLAVGDVLGFGTSGLLEKLEAAKEGDDPAEGYKVSFEVVRKTGYMGKGVDVLVHAD